MSAWRPGDDERREQAAARFLGHATVALRLDGVALLTDPILRGHVAHLRHRQPKVAGGFEERPDAILISHIHQDHLDFPSLARFGRDIPLIVPRGAGRLVQRHGFVNVEELSVGECARVGCLVIRATHARHHGRRPPFGPTAACLGYLVEGSRRVYFAGDTDLFPEMAALGPVDLALLPVWGWGPTLGPGHLDPARAARALTLIRPRIAVPIHWGSLLPLGLGLIHQHQYLVEPPLRFAALAAALTPEVDVRILQPGETLRLPARTA